MSSNWAATVASLWIQCTSGSAYCFGIYSPLLKSSQSYDQSTLDTVAFFKDLGANAGVLSGLLYSSSGPRLVLAAGAAQCFVGYFLMWLAVTGALPRPPVPLMCLFMLLAAHAQTFFNTADVVTAVHNFPSYRGTVVGIMKGFLGLSGAILIQLYQTVYNGNSSYFLLMLAVLPTFLPLVLMYFVKVHPSDGGDNKQLLDGFSLIALIIAGYIMALIIWENVGTMGSPAHILTFLVLVVLLSSPITIVVRGHMRDTRVQYETSSPERTPLTNAVGPSEVTEQRKSDASLAGKSCLKSDSSAHWHEAPDRDAQMPQMGENLSILQAMQTCDFWLLFLAMACGMGSGLATVNNISQIGSSLGYRSVETSTLISLWSIWNFLGRFGTGYISDYFLRIQGYARPIFMAITLATMSIGHAIISSGLPGALYVGSVLVGVCYGSQWSLMPTITSEIFGLRHFGTIFNAISIASPLGSYILSVRVVGYIYDMEASTSDTSTCTGIHCFMLSFLIMASVSLFGSIVALALFIRTRIFYKQVIFARLQHSVIM
uniref:Protein NUCLEAR FUSION DEFECTIVE 4 n=1 Tax=Elaeis guineensis var. tenera TaxID=51953 RepID=A0A6I9QZJ4_ELAGV|nr:protein NUCLEAR FUSION DEFECTIVE 4 [Elaeis guineensis]